MADLFSKYSDKFREELIYLKCYHGDDNEELRAHVDRATEMAAQDGADETLGVTYYYIANAFFVTDNLQETVRFCDMAGAYLMDSEQYTLLILLYNLYGAIMILEGNDNTAMDYLMTAIDIIREHDVEAEAEIIYNNIAIMFTSSGGYAAALPLFRKCWETLENKKGDRENSFNRINVYSWIGICLLRTGRTEGIVRFGDELDRMIAKADAEKSLYPKFTACLFKAEKAFIMGEEDNKGKAISELEAVAMKANYTEYAQEYKGYTDLLLKYCGEDTVRHFAEHLAVMVEEPKYTDYTKINLYSMLINCCRKIGESEKVQEYCDIYYELSTRRYQDSYRNLRKTMNAHEQIYRLHKSEQKIKLENQKLALEAKRDELTGLPNRTAFDEYIDKFFREIADGNQKFAVEIFDIDSFKTINDTYGHLAGDAALKAIGECLKKAAEDNACFAARYGGDEFVILEDGWDAERAERFAKELAKSVAEKNIPNENSNVSGSVTISQGIFIHSEADGHMGLLDCFVKADKALYKAKKYGGNRVEVSNGRGHKKITEW